MWISVGLALRAKADMSILRLRRRSCDSEIQRRNWPCFRRARAAWPRAGESLPGDKQSDNRLPENLRPKDITERARG